MLQSCPKNRVKPKVAMTAKPGHKSCSFSKGLQLSGPMALK